MSEAMPGAYRSRTRSGATGAPTPVRPLDDDEARDLEAALGRPLPEHLTVDLDTPIRGLLSGLARLARADHEAAKAFRKAAAKDAARALTDDADPVPGTEDHREPDDHRGAMVGRAILRWQARSHDHDPNTAKGLRWMADHARDMAPEPATTTQ